MIRLFISDLHLDPARPDLTRAFFDLLEGKALEADELYILGDFFEVWLGDDDDAPFNRSIIEALATYKKPIFLMHGNRDFLLGQEFCKAAGATLLPDPSVITLSTPGSEILLMHGDSLCTKDEAYMQARVLLRDANFQRDFLSKSLAERKVFAKSLRKQSQEHNREKASDIMDVTPSEVVKSMVEHGVQSFIHGHTHRPYVHDLELTDGSAAKRYVLGDWDASGWYLEARDAELSLVEFVISS